MNELEDNLIYESRLINAELNPDEAHQLVLGHIALQNCMQTGVNLSDRGNFRNNRQEVNDLVRHKAYGPFVDVNQAYQEYPEVYSSVYDGKQDRLYLRMLNRLFRDDTAIENRIKFKFGQDRPEEQLDQSQQVGNTLDDFMKKAGQYRILTREEEAKLAQNMKFGVAAYKKIITDQDFDNQQLLAIAREGAFAYQAFFHTNLRLVMRHVFARKDMFQHLEPQDALQMAYLGVQSAIEKFDERKGHKFSTYATNWIKQSIKRKLSDEGRMIRLPVHVEDRRVKYITARAELTTKLGREPTTDEIQAAEPSIKNSDFDAFQQFGDFRTLSLNESLKDGSAEVIDYLEDDGASRKHAEGLSNRDELERLMARAGISEVEKIIISLSHGVQLVELEGYNIGDLLYQDAFDRVIDMDGQAKSTKHKTIRTILEKLIPGITTDSISTIEKQAMIKLQKTALLGQ